MAKILKCQDCNNLALELVKDKCDLHCCGKPLTELIPNTHEGAGEKHIPVLSKEGNLVHVNVGEVNHPMLEAHYIEWIALETNHGLSIKYLKPGQAPHADFALVEGEEVIQALAYCNIHGLWAGK